MNIVPQNEPLLYQAWPPMPGKLLTITISDPLNPRGRRVLCEMEVRGHRIGPDVCISEIRIPQKLFQ